MPLLQGSTEMKRPWHGITIAENGEALVPLPPALLRWDPHPYVALGAPYPATSDPFRLRSSVAERLLIAQERLQASTQDVVEIGISNTRRIIFFLKWFDP